jgi:hypothetical protein
MAPTYQVWDTTPQIGIQPQYQEMEQYWQLYDMQGIINMICIMVITWRRLIARLLIILGGIEKNLMDRKLTKQ